MEETPKKNTRGFGCEREDVDENSDGNDEQSDDGDEQSDDDNSKHCDNEVNSVDNSFRFTEANSSIDLFTKLFENPLLNANVQISKYPR